MSEDYGLWTPAELELGEALQDGRTLVVNMSANGHPHLWRWAQRRRLAVRIDRRSVWGNPFVMGADGDRDTVCDWFAAFYWPHKPSLHTKVDQLGGKALGCWCAPQRCHGDFLARLAVTS